MDHIILTQGTGCVVLEVALFLCAAHLLDARVGPRLHGPVIQPVDEACLVLALGVHVHREANLVAHLKAVQMHPVGIDLRLEFRAVEEAGEGIPERLRPIYLFSNSELEWILF